MGKNIKVLKYFFIYLIISFFLSACATVQQQQHVANGINFNPGQPRAKVMQAIVSTITNEGYSIATINDEYGLISCQPYTALSGVLMEKLGIPGGAMVATDSHLREIIHFSAVVAPNGAVHLRALDTTPTRDWLTGQKGTVNTRYTLKLQAYLKNKILASLGVKNATRAQ